MARLVLLFLFPALELYLLVEVGSKTGALNMVLWVFASAGLGMWAVREQGQSTLNRVRGELSQGRVPQESIVDGLLVFFAGVLLILPGLISDAVGALLLIPFTRGLFLRLMTRYLMVQQAKQPGRSPGPARFVFYRSEGFSSGGFFSSNTQAHEANNMEEPRRATVIDHGAIETDSERNADSRGKGANPEGEELTFDCEARDASAPGTGDASGSGPGRGPAGGSSSDFGKKDA